MSDLTNSEGKPPLPAKNPYRRARYKLERGTKITIDGLPTAEEMDLAAARHKGDEADRFTLYSPDQIMQESKDVKLCISFEDVIKVRDQAEMIIAGMRAIIEKTRQHDIGSVRQRIEARAEAASLGRALSRFNGRTPYGDWKPRPRKA